MMVSIQEELEYINILIKNNNLMNEKLIALKLSLEDYQKIPNQIKRRTCDILLIELMKQVGLYIVDLDEMNMKLKYLTE